MSARGKGGGVCWDGAALSDRGAKRIRGIRAIMPLPFAHRRMTPCDEIRATSSQTRAYSSCRRQRGYRSATIAAKEQTSKRVGGDEVESTDLRRDRMEEECTCHSPRKDSGLLSTARNSPG